MHRVRPEQQVHGGLGIPAIATVAALARTGLPDSAPCRANRHALRLASRPVVVAHLERRPGWQAAGKIGPGSQVPRW